MQQPVDLLEPQFGLMAWTLVALGVFVLLAIAVIYGVVRLLRAHSKRGTAPSGRAPSISDRGEE